MVPDGLIFVILFCSIQMCMCEDINFLYVPLKAEDEFTVFVYSSTSPKVTLRYAVQLVGTLYYRESFHPMLYSKCQSK